MGISDLMQKHDLATAALNSQSQEKLAQFTASHPVMTEDVQKDFDMLRIELDHQRERLQQFQYFELAKEALAVELSVKAKEQMNALDERKREIEDALHAKRLIQEEERRKRGGPER